LGKLLISSLEKKLHKKENLKIKKISDKRTKKYKKISKS